MRCFSCRAIRVLLRLRLLVAAACILAALPAAPALAWWGQGHEYITESAVQHLPLPLRGFFAANVAEVAGRSGGEPPGSHYIDIDYYPEFHAGTFPRDRNALVAIYGSSVVNSNGTGPWTYVNHVNNLSLAMAAADTPAQWRALLPTAAAMAHYIEDLHNPLHLTLNYNGQLTGNFGIHGRYEGEMIERHLDELTIAAATAVYLPSPLDFVFDGIDAHYPRVAEIIAADDLAGGTYNTAYYDAMWAETGEFTHDLFQQASLAVASSWYTAWINAGSPRTFLASAADFQADGDVDGEDLAVWTAAFGATAVGDASGDGVSDGTDFLLWQRQLSGGPAASGGLNVPEPGGWELFGVAVLAVTASRFMRIAFLAT
jgi:hypothetical protein